jgi:hypothetical protein
MIAFCECTLRQPGPCLFPGDESCAKCGAKLCSDCLREHHECLDPLESIPTLDREPAERREPVPA